MPYADKQITAKASTSDAAPAHRRQNQASSPAPVASSLEHGTVERMLIRAVFNIEHIAPNNKGVRWRNQLNRAQVISYGDTFRQTNTSEKATTNPVSVMHFAANL